MERRGRRQDHHLTYPPIEGANALQLPIIDVPPRPKLTVVSDAPDVAAFTSSFIDQKISRLASRQAQLDAALGKSYDREDNLYRSFSVAKHVVNLEMAEDEMQRDRVIQGLLRDVKTNLIERVKADTVPLRYSIINGQLYPELSDHDSIGVQAKRFPEESIRVMIETGIAERLKHGTLERKREQAELDGWNKLEAIMVDPQTPIETTYTIFSPQSSITAEGKKGAYDKNFINRFTLKERDGKRYVELIQRDVDLDKEGFRNAAASLDAHFWDEYDQWEKYHQGEKPPFDAYLLARPIKGALPEVLTEGKRMMLPFFEEAIYHDPLLQGMIDYYIKGVVEAAGQDSPDWKDLCIRFNAILNRTDTLTELAKKYRELGHKYQIYPVRKKPEPAEAWAVHQMVQNLGRKTPKEVGGAGCPTNKGYDVGDGFGSSPLAYKGSVAEAASKRDYSGANAKDDPNLCRCNGTEPHFHCPGDGGSCGHAIIVGEGTSTCPKCGAGQVC